jgi:4-diphosphocytidyl-2-C-methyl-D-erythritol kinase
VRAEAHTVDPVDTLAALDAGDPEALGASLRNDLQDAALSLRPGLADRLELVRSSGCEAVLLSGSGPTVLGLARTQDDATEVRRTLLEAGLAVVHVATGPVAGAHVVEYA